MKESYNIQTKRAMRGRIRSFLERTYPKRKDREKIKVLTLLGHEGHEINEIWDPLGVPRENITSLERDRQAYELSIHNNPGVQILNGDLEVYDWTNKKYDVINLDFVSPFGFYGREIIRKISGNQVLGQKGVLITWFLGKRETRYSKKWFIKEQERLMHISSESIKERSELLSKMICAIMIDGTVNLGPHPVIQGSQIPKYNEVLEDKLRQIEKEHPETTPEWIAFVRNYSGRHVAQMMEYVKNLFGEKLAQMGVTGDINYFMSELLYYSKIGSYFSYATERYRYISDHNSPMLVDINAFRHHDFSLIGTWDVNPQGGLCIHTRYFGSNGLLQVDNNWRVHGNGFAYRLLTKEERKNVIGLIKLFEDFRRKTNSTTDQRIFLGSSYVTPMKKTKITREEAFDLLNAGFSPVEIAENYRGFTKMQLAAFKAHMTMGTYKGIEN